MLARNICYVLYSHVSEISQIDSNTASMSPSPAHAAVFWDGMEMKSSALIFHLEHFISCHGIKGICFYTDTAGDKKRFFHHSKRARHSKLEFSIVQYYEKNVLVVPLSVCRTELAISKEEEKLNTKFSMLQSTESRIEPKQSFKIPCPCTHLELILGVFHPFLL